MVLTKGVPSSVDKRKEVVMNDVDIILDQEAVYIWGLKYLLSFVVGIVVTIVVSWYNNSSNSFVSEIKSYEKRSSTNRKRGKEKRRKSSNRRQ